MEEAGQMAQIKDAEGLERHLKLWAETPPASSSSSMEMRSGKDDEDENEIRQFAGAVVQRMSGAVSQIRGRVGHDVPRPFANSGYVPKVHRFVTGYFYVILTVYSVLNHCARGAQVFCDF